MSEMHLRQPGFTYSACGTFTKTKKKKETGDSRYIYQNELNKACFQHDMITRRTAFGTTLRDKTFDIAKNPKYDRYQRDLSSMVYKFF